MEVCSRCQQTKKYLLGEVSSYHPVCQNCAKFSFPRIIDFCIVCHNKIQLSFTDGIPRWVHLKECSFQSQEKTDLYKWSKDVIVTLIKEQGLEIITKCSKHNSVVNTKIPKNNNIITDYDTDRDTENEPWIENLIIQDDHDQILYGIYLYLDKPRLSKHKNDPKWFSLNVSDIEYQVSVKNLVFTNLKEGCDCQPVKLETAERATKTGIEVQPRTEPGTKPGTKPNTQTNLPIIVPISPSPPLPEVPLPAAPIKTLELDLEFFAMKAGYLIYEPSKEFYLYRMAWFGSSDIPIGIRNASPNKYISDKEWEEFIRQNKCLFCKIHTRTSNKKPYCLSCYKNIVKGNVKIFPQFPSKIEIRHRDLLRSKFDWLKEIPPKSQKYPNCTKCKTPVHQEINFTKKYDGKGMETKGICMSCFEKEIREKGMLELFSQNK